jgi:HD superfamily phosphodiesterase
MTRIKKAYIPHVEGCVKYALLLAEKYNADKFIVEVSAWLHDIGADAGKKHPAKSTEMAKEFLSTFEIPKDTLKRILDCIKNHAMGTDVNNLEEQIIQDADGIIFLEDTYKSFYENGKSGASSVEEAKKWATEKTNGMMNKIKTEEGKRIAEELLPIAIKWIGEQSNNFHGVIIEESLESKDVLKKVKIIKTEVEQVTEEHKTPWIKQWTLHTVEIPKNDVDSIAEEISKSLDSEHNWYADFKDETTHYIIFKERVFKIDRTNKEQYDEAKSYGISLGIPEYQVDFHPEVKEWER